MVIRRSAFTANGLSVLRTPFEGVGLALSAARQHRPGISGRLGSGRNTWNVNAHSVCVYGDGGMHSEIE